MFGIRNNFKIVELDTRTCRSTVYRWLFLTVGPNRHAFSMFSFLYSLARANDVFARLLPASWNADGERVAKTNVLLYLALPSFPPSFFFLPVFILAFYSANLTIARMADPQAECIYRRLCDFRNGALKNLRTSSSAYVRQIYAHPCLCCYLIKYGLSFHAARYISKTNVYIQQNSNM